MTTVLDDILSIATGGYKADGIIELCNKAANAKNIQQQIQVEWLSRVQQYGIDFILRQSPNPNGYIDVSTFSNDICIQQDNVRHFQFEITTGGNRRYNINPENDTQRYNTQLSWSFILGLGLPVESRQDGGYRVRIPAHMIKSCKVELSNAYDDKYQKYEGKPVLEIKSALEAEFTKCLSKYHDYNNKCSVFFPNSLMGYRRTSRMENGLTLADYRNIVKLLFPTVSTRRDGKDLDKQGIMNSILAGGAKPRDFGIRDLDMLLYVWQTLIGERRPTFNKSDVARLKSWKIDDMVEFITACGGTLHGGKVGARKNFNKQPVTEEVA
jgi:hypothetical protein